MIHEPSFEEISGNINNLSKDLFSLKCFDKIIKKAVYKYMYPSDKIEYSYGNDVYISHEKIRKYHNKNKKGEL